MVPSSLSIWTQRAGRAGRAGEDADVFLLVEPSVFQKKGVGGKGGKGKTKKQEPKSEPKDDEVDVPADVTQEDEAEFKKKLEDGLREWIETTGCRRAIADQYFNNPKRASIGSEAPTPSRRCCDNCLHRDTIEQKPNVMSETHQAIRTDKDRHMTTDDTSNANAEEDDVNAENNDDVIAQDNDDTNAQDNEQEPSTIPNENGKRPMTEKLPGERRGDRLQRCKDALMQWRDSCWEEHYGLCTWDPDVLLPDVILRKVAKVARIRSVEDMAMYLPEPWAFANVHGAEVLDVVSQVDRDFRREVEEQREEQKTKKRKETEEKAAQREEKRRAEQAMKTAKREWEKEVKRQRVQQAMANSHLTEPAAGTVATMAPSSITQYASFADPYAAYAMPVYTNPSVGPSRPPELAENTPEPAANGARAEPSQDHKPITSQPAGFPATYSAGGNLQ